MLKVMGLVLILTAAVGTGYSISRELSLREKNLRQYLMLIISLKGEIRYGNSSLAEAFQRTVPRLQGLFVSWQKNLQKSLARWKESLWNSFYVENILLKSKTCMLRQKNRSLYVPLETEWDIWTGRLKCGSWNYMKKS